MRRKRGISMVMAAGLLMVGACGGGADAPEVADPGAGEVGGMTREEIEASAAAMDPATAESLGIVDTTIRVEIPMPAESIDAVPLTPDSGGAAN